MERKKSKISLLLLLLLLELFSSHQLRAEEITESKMDTNVIANPIEPYNFNDRISKIESENHQQKLELSLLKTTVNEDKKAIAYLTNSLEDQKMVINQLNGRIVQLEASYANHSTIIDKNTVEIWENQLPGKENQRKNGKVQFRLKRQATAETNRKPRNLCSDSSRLCSFFHPDHPDVLKATKITTNSSSYKMAMEKVYGPPSSCQELNQLGHTLSGMYMVNGGKRQLDKILAVYCNFNDLQNSETLIGNVEVKTASVHFYVQRQSDFDTEYTIIPFEVEQLNVGGAMDSKIGVFTAPVPGIYHFGFSCLMHEKSWYLDIFLQLNGNNIGLATSNTEQYGGKAYLTISLHASVRLKKGDRINLYKRLGTLRDNGDHYTHFSGWLVEEEIMTLFPVAN